MIRFIPVIREIESPLSSPKDFANNLANKNIAQRLNKSFEGKLCEHHPLSDKNIFEVDMALSSTGSICSLISYCCEDFKPILELIAKNKNPFPNQDEIES